MTATNRIKISKKDFVQHLFGKYDADGTSLIHAALHDERCWDDFGEECFKRLTLYYKGDRHIATWMAGQAWEIKCYDSKGVRLTDCCGCYSTYHDDELICRACYQQVGVGQGDGAEEKEMV